MKKIGPRLLSLALTAIMVLSMLLVTFERNVSTENLSAWCHKNSHGYCSLDQMVSERVRLLSILYISGNDDADAFELFFQIFERNLSNEHNVCLPEVT